ncbi:hypothetical protein MNB_SM-3-928 [hydrothermal vent metagenome]|uniref:Uncharacterized protein n=1 Tax=hydrothermal vent metagenome TaxID=652676 RepID=A0A1W1D305_9ZZZZ
MDKFFKNISFSLFFKVNFLVTTILFLLFLMHNSAYTFISFIMSFFGALSSVILLYVVLYIFFFPFLYFKRFVLYFAGIVFFLVDIGLIIDFFIYRLYKFHINGMVINILTSPSAMDSIELGIAPVVLFFSLVIGLLFFEFFLIRKLFSFPYEQKYLINKKINQKIIVPFIIIVKEKKI